MVKNIFQKMGPAGEHSSNNNAEDSNPDKARNWVLTWYSLVAIVVIIYLIIK